jgi:hypothetical protein
MRVRIRRLGVAGAMIVALMTAMLAVTASPAQAAINYNLRPNATIVNSGWSVNPAQSAHNAVDDPVLQPTPVDASDYLYAGLPGRYIELGFTDLGPSPRSSLFYKGQLWYYNNTGPTTRLQVDLLVGGAIVSTAIFPAGQGFGWHTAFVPAGTIDGTNVNAVSARFTALDGGDVNLRAVYFEAQEGGYKFRNGFYNTSYLDVKNAATNDGALAAVTAGSNSLSQVFGTIDTREGSALKAQHDYKCLTPLSRGTASGTAIVQYGCVYDDAQVYDFRPMGNGRYQVFSVRTGLCLSPRITLYVQQEVCSSATTQQWYIERVPL